MALITLFSGQAANGSSAAVDLPLDRVGVGDVFVAAQGAFGGGTVKVQWSGDGGTTWVDVAGSSLTAAGTARITLPSAGKVRGDLAGATTPSVTAFLAT